MVKLGVELKLKPAIAPVTLFPMWLVVAILALGSGVLALPRVKEVSSNGGCADQITVRQIVLTGALAIGILLAVIVTRGDFVR